jgi:hypothetical protein
MTSDAMGQGNDQAMSEVLNAIHDEAMKLLNLNPSPEAQVIIERIIAIARYEHDLRTDDERGPVASPED